MDQTNEFIVPEELDDERFDAVIASLSEGHSRSYLKTLIKDGSVLLNGKEAKPSAKVHENDVIRLVLPEKMIPDILPENIPLDILYEDEDVLVVNKPKGMVVHPAPGHYSGTLVNAVMYRCRDQLSGINAVMYFAVRIFQMAGCAESTALAVTACIVEVNTAVAQFSVMQIGLLRTLTCQLRHTCNCLAVALIVLDFLLYHLCHIRIAM